MSAEPQKHKVGKLKYVEPYDFRHPKLFSKEIMRSLQTIHDAISRNLSRVFSTSLRYKVDIFLNKIEQLSSPDFMQNIENPSVVYLLKIEELGGEIIIVLPPEFCLHLIERQSGGQNRVMGEPRSFTTIEEKIMYRVIQKVNDEIVDAWEPYIDLKIAETVYESKSENLHLASVDPTLIIKFAIDLGEEQTEMYVSYSYNMLKKAMSDTILKKGQNSRLEKLSAEELDAYKRTLLKANVKIRPLLGTTTLTLKEVVDLKEGDIIPLKQKTDKPLEIRVNQKTKMTGYPGLIQGRKAVKVYEVVEEINEMELV